MLDPAATETEEESSLFKPVSADTVQHGQIQKISQEGSKNTYVLILSKDYLKSESSNGQSLLKYSSVSSQSGKSNTRKILPPSGGDYDSPSGQVPVTKKKLLRPPEDVKLNLSNINDDEYDSNKSSSSVFLQESGFSEPDSDKSTENSSSSNVSSGNSSNLINLNAHSFFCEKSQMNTYVIPTPVTPHAWKARLEQHAFKKTSPLKLADQVSLVGLTANSSGDKTSQSTAKKVLVTPNKDEGFTGKVKKTVYSNEAVPTVVGSTEVLATSLLQKTNPKAVPTFSNISPINQQHVSQSTFIPISPAESPAYGATSTGPLTSTPLNGETNRRSQKVRQESSTHRPVYVIPSPFNRQSSSVSALAYQSRLDIFSPQVQTPSMNNSSGFISASSSMETPEISRSYEEETNRQAESIYTPMECKEVSSEMAVDKEGSEDKKNDGSGGVVICVNKDSVIEELDEGFDSNSLDPSVCSSQESETGDQAEKGRRKQEFCRFCVINNISAKTFICFIFELFHLTS